MEYKMKKRNVFFCKAVIVVVSMMSMVGTAFARIPSPVQLEVSNGWNLICSPHKGWVPYDNPTINEYIFNTKRGYYVRKKYLFTYIEGEYRQHPFVRSLDRGIGYWVYLKDLPHDNYQMTMWFCNQGFIDQPPSLPEGDTGMDEYAPLPAGWSMVGLGSKRFDNSKIICIYRYDPVDNVYEYVGRDKPNERMELGYGYWVFCLPSNI
jgi:hypothetical protein